MKKIILFVLLGLSVILSAFKIHKKQKNFQMNIKVHVVIHSMEGYGQDSSFARSAAALLEKIVNSDYFKQAVINNKYSRKKHLNSTEIYNRIMLAHEEEGPGGLDQVIDLRLRTINLKDDGKEWMENCQPGSDAGTIGIDGAGTGVAAVCPQWLRSTAISKDTLSLAAHFIHEYMHTLGFDHNRRASKSVPYKLQNIVEEYDE